TVMADSEESTVTYTEVSSPFADLLDIRSPRVDGSPVMPEDPYAYVVGAFQAPLSPDYVPGPEEPEQAPPSPVYVPYLPKPVYPFGRSVRYIESPGVDGPPVMPDDQYACVVAAFQAPPSPDYMPVYVPYVPKLVYPEFMPLEDEVLLAEEQPLPTGALPTADSLGYVPKSLGLTSPFGRSVRVMSDSEDFTVTYMEVSSPFMDLSDIESPGVDGPPVMLKDPYAYMVATFQAPPSPDYVPGPEKPEQALPSPVYVP
ncbi:hypothetical protein Tco_0013242, partial [Tanacetum coccineum]